MKDITNLLNKNLIISSHAISIYDSPFKMFIQFNLVVAMYFIH